MAKIPKFIDKIIYTNDQSYPISSSFRGILRLSPNNKQSHKQRPLIQLTDQENDTGAANYADNIDFDGTEPDGSFTDCDLDTTMILCTDSDGYSVGFRLSATNPEFDNLGVIGITEAKTLQLYTTNKDSFTINGQIMPMESQNDINKKSFLVMKNNKWEYEYPDDFIKETILDILRSFETIPTGSIHWCPVTIKQYKALCEKQTNKYTHNKTDSDPLVRDFLVCDGRKYLCADFPELAKILKDEEVSCHFKKDYEYTYEYVDKDGETKVATETKTSYHPGQIKSISSKSDGADNELFYFNVPDLRHMFISSVIAKGIHGSSNNASANDILSPDSGTYTPDCNAEGITIDKNQHRHFTAYGTWQVRGYSDYYRTYPDVYPNIKIQYNDRTFSKNFTTSPDTNYHPTTPVIDPESYYGKDKIQALTNKQIIGIMPLHNHPYAYYTTTGGTASGGMIGFGQRIGQNNRREHSGANSVSAAYFLSRPNYSKPNFNVKYVGRSSYDIDCFESSSDNSGTDYESLSAGHENIGTFYAMLPLIKI